MAAPAETPGIFTRAEALGAGLCAVLATAIVAAWLSDAVGLFIHPFVILGVAVATAGAACFFIGRRAASTAGDTAGLCAAMGGVFAWLIWLAWPSLLLLGRGPDLAHHFVLIDYIERHWQLVHGTPVGMGEMAQYTPGGHSLIVLAGAWVRSDAFHAAHAVLALTVALKAGFVFLVTLRLLPRHVPRVSLALVAVLLLLVPRAHLIGSFTHDSFVAQVVSELFTVAMWWALVAWDDTRRPAALALFALAGVAAFLSWPVYVGAPMLAFGLLAIARGDGSFSARVKHIIMGTGPIVLVAAVYVLGRLQWLGMVQTSAAVIWPSRDEFAWWFVLLSAAGLVAAALRRSGRGTALFAGAIALQAGALFVLARSRGADTPYMALKMLYLAIYPMAALAALTLAVVWQRVTHAAGEGSVGSAVRGRIGSMVLGSVVVIAIVLTGRQLLAVPRAKPVVSEALYEAGRWARDHVTRNCVDYLVSDEYTGYWLHLAVLGNPRDDVALRTSDRFDPRRAMARWIEPAGLPFAVSDLSILPNDIRSQVDVLAQFGTAAVIKRRGPSTCSSQRP